MKVDALAEIAKASHVLRDWGLPYTDLVEAHERLSELMAATREGLFALRNAALNESEQRRVDRIADAVERCFP